MFSKNIKSYYRGDIDGAQCARECSAFLVSAGAGAGGVGLGVTLCAGAGPIGLLLGGLAMGCMASSAAEFFTRRAFDGLLGDDRARAVNKAYCILELAKGAPDKEIKKSYYRLALEHHPDKGGDRLSLSKSLLRTR